MSNVRGASSITRPRDAGRSSGHGTSVGRRALEDSIIQFGGEKTNEIYVSSSFEIVDGDLEDLTKPLRRWLVPSSDSLDSVSTKTWTGPWREANRFDSDSTDGTFAYVDANHPTWLGSIEPHADAGPIVFDKTRVSRVHMYKIRIRYTSLPEGAV